MKNICKNCGIEYSRPPSQIGEYCTRKCCYSSSDWVEKQAKAKKGCTRSMESRLKQSSKTKGVPKPQSFKEKMRKITTERYDKIGRKLPLYNRIRLSKKYQQWRKVVFERDGYKCVQCGDNRGGNLEADHMISLSFLLTEMLLQGTINENALYDVDNGQTLCTSCHKKTTSYGKHMKHHLEYRLFDAIESYRKQLKTNEDSSAFYSREMEKIIQHYKEKLN